eukprot:gene7599-7803_t
MAGGEQAQQVIDLLLDPDAGSSSSGGGGLHHHDDGGGGSSGDVTAGGAAADDLLSGVGRQVQVLLSLDSPASWGFAAGSVPIVLPAGLVVIVTVTLVLRRWWGVLVGLLACMLLEWVVRWVVRSVRGFVGRVEGLVVGGARGR